LAEILEYTLFDQQLNLGAEFLSLYIKIFLQ